MIDNKTWIRRTGLPSHLWKRRWFPFMADQCSKQNASFAFERELSRIILRNILIHVRDHDAWPPHKEKCPQCISPNRRRQRLPEKCHKNFPLTNSIGRNEIPKGQFYLPSIERNILVKVMWQRRIIIFLVNTIKMVKVLDSGYPGMSIRYQMYQNTSYTSSWTHGDPTFRHPQNQKCV